MAESRLRSEEEAMKDQASKDGKVAVKHLLNIIETALWLPVRS